MYELRDHPLRRTLLSPVSDTVSLILCFASALVLVGGNFNWLGIASACFLVAFFVRSYTAGLRVDAFGLTVSNRFIRHRVPWQHITGVWVPEPNGYETVRVLRIESRRGRFFGIAVVATLGMNREELRRAAHELADLARQNGADVKAAGSDADVEAQLASEDQTQ